MNSSSKVPERLSAYKKIMLHLKNSPHLHAEQTTCYALAIVLFVLYAFLQRGTNRIWISDTLNSLTVIIIASAGQMYVMLIRGVDLSIAGIISLTNCFCSLFMPGSAVGIVFFCIGVAVFGAAAGFLNGYIITRFRLQPFIVTFASWFIWGGLSYCVLPLKRENSFNAFSEALMRRIGIVPISVFLIAGVCLVWFYLRRTRFGVSLYAVEHNKKTAYYSGINVTRVTVLAYVLSGALAAFAGIYLTAFNGYGSPNSGDSYILLTICAALLGGSDMMGGRGSLAGTIAGCVILELSVDILLLLDTPVYWAQFVRGALFIAVIFLRTALSISRRIS